MQKRILLIVWATILPGMLFANGFEIKAGVGSVRAANNKAGFDAAIAYSLKLERYFAFVPELNFNWINFDQCATDPCKQVPVGGITKTLLRTRNHYTFPLLLNARLLIPLGEDTPVVQPYITVGAGYGWSFYRQETPAYTEGANSFPAQTVNDSATGFMYQAILGFSLNLGMMTEGSPSMTNLILEGGYRGGQVSKGGFSSDMSGYVVRLGVGFNI
ncbi:MAG: hypothetical protein N2Z22_05430 [Turneriella sp.]|nr:hypothetical protein [Turneriella sp.]